MLYVDFDLLMMVDSARAERGLSYVTLESVCSLNLKITGLTIKPKIRMERRKILTILVMPNRKNICI
jgi:hypothetical protein